MTQMEMIPCFTDVLHVPNLSTADHLMTVIKNSGVSDEYIFTNQPKSHLCLKVVGETGLSELSRRLSGRKANIGVRIFFDVIISCGLPGEEVAWPAGHGRADRGGGEGWQAVGQAGGGDVCGLPVVSEGDVHGLPQAGGDVCGVPVVDWNYQKQDWFIDLYL